MKSIRNLPAALFILGGCIALISLLHAQEQDTAIPVQAMTDEQVMLQAVEQTPPTPAAELPEDGNFHSAQHPEWPPLPGNMWNVPGWNLGGNMILLDDLQVDYPAASVARAGSRSLRSGGMQMMSMDPGDGGDDTNSDGGYSPSFTPTPIDTNGLWLQIFCLSNSTAYLALNNATDCVYEVMTKTALTNASWNTETELWPTNTNSMPFTVPELDRTNTLFFWARDWTGVDDNTNGITDWWEWKYFGNLSHSGSDYDSSGANTLAYDYANGIDPNIIQFSIESTNDYVNYTNVAVQLDITAGVPSSYAVVINGTNFNGATWNSYTSSNLTVNLGTTDGVYTVNVGLRGLPADATQTWRDYGFTVDRVAPLLVITNPVNASGTATVIKPWLQLQGYADKSVAGITWGVSNVLGCVSNLPGQLTEVAGFDAVHHQYKTNWFQCCDVPLATNGNLITLRVNDRAGNATTTNFNVTLDYSAATNPPAINLLWPQDGMAVSGTNITVRGTMSDETGTIQAQVVDEDGDTNIINAVVERNGMFWVDNVPVDGETEIMLTATDAAGNVTVSSLTIEPSDLALTISSTPTGDDLYQPSGTVGGTVGDPDAIVTVNGVTAAVDGSAENDDGTYNWTATNAPVYGMGTATFDAVASPPEMMEHRGVHAMTSGGGSSGANASVAVVMGAKLMITHYQFTEVYADTVGYSWGADYYQRNWTRSYDRQWKAGSNGQMQQTYQANETVLDTGFGGSTNVWSDPAPFDADGFVASDLEADDTGSTEGEVIVYVYHNFGKGAHQRWEYGFDIIGEELYDDLMVAADTQWTLYTGGRGVVNRRSLFAVDAAAWANGWSAGGLMGTTLWWGGSPVAGLADAAIRGLGQPLGDDGKVWTMQPDNTPVLLNLAANNNAASVQATVTQQKYELKIRVNDAVTLDPDKVVDGANFCVGQGITFDISNLFSGLLSSSDNDAVVLWTLPGTFVNTNSDPNCDLFYEKNPAFLGKAWLRDGTVSTHCWYVLDTKNATAKVDFTLYFGNGNAAVQLPLTGKFNIHRPTTAKANPYQPDGTPMAQAPGILRLGVSGVTNDMSFKHTITTDAFCAGQAGYVQVITYSDINAATAASGTFTGDALDAALGEFPTDRQTTVPANATTTLNKFYDAPNVGLKTSGAPSTEDVHFSTYLMFNPNSAGSIWVPLRLITWELHDTATYNGDGTWSAVSSTIDTGQTQTTTQNPSGNDNETTAFPRWTTTK